MQWRRFPAAFFPAAAPPARLTWIKDLRAKRTYYKTAQDGSSRLAAKKENTWSGK